MNPLDPNRAHCWQCGYQLRGVESSICPECGRPFDRAEPSTMNFGRPMGRFAQWTLAPLGWRMGWWQYAFGLYWMMPVSGLVAALEAALSIIARQTIALAIYF